MAKHILDPRKSDLFSIDDDEATPKKNFETQEQEIDEATGLPLWSLNLNLKQGNQKRQAIVVKIASQEQPKVTALTHYVPGGDFIVTDYIQNGSNRSSYSYKIEGGLVPANSAPVRPQSQKNEG